MTALCGIYSPENPEYSTHERLDAMLQAIRHRGGHRTRKYIDKGRGLAFAASFLPPSTHQDQINWYEDLGYVSTLDGHIHNSHSILGGPSHNTPDIAAAVALHRSESRRFPSALDGSFALVLWDKVGAMLWLARDVLGRRPLYYSAEKTGIVLFASEPKAILAHGLLSPNINREALSAYITFGCVPAPLTLFEGINKLFPGEALRIDAKGLVYKHDYCRIPRFQASAESLDDLAKPIRDSFLETLEKHVRKAERVGVLLSGGADSTILLGALRVLGIRDRHTFTLSHSSEGQQIDNRDDCHWAQAMAEKHEATHHVIDVDGRPSAMTREPELLRLFDDPVILENRVAGCELLSREAAKNEVQLCLSGNNQQAFGGIWEWKTLRELIGQDSLQHLTNEELALKAHLNLFSIQEQSALLRSKAKDVTKLAASVLSRYVQRIDASDVFDLVAGTSLLLRSPEQFIPFEERIAVLNGVEISYPLFDPLLIGVANRVPTQLRGRDSESMCLAALRWAFRDVLPDDVANRPKVAYPRDPWTDAKSPKLAELFLSEEALKRSDVFEPEVVKAIISASASRNNISSRRQLWTILFFQIWYECYIRRDDMTRLDEAFSSLLESSRIRQYSQLRHRGGKEWP